ncbi:MAG: PAS domain S-box protein, partial [Candidatus Omnitrophota bacterium]
MSFFRFSCKSGEHLIAAGVIAVDKARKIEHRDIVESYLNLAGMAIQRFHAVENMKQSESILKQVLDSIPTGIMMIDGKEKRIMNANAAARNLLGCPERDLAGVSCLEMFCLDNREGCPVMDKKIKMDFSEQQLRKGSGETIPILKSIVPVALNGRGIFIESFIDISERKRNEAIIAAEKEMLAVTLRSIGDGVIAVNRKKEILLMNKAAESLLGLREGAVAGKNFDETVRILDAKTKYPIRGFMDRVLEKGDSVELREGLLVCHDGVQRLISDSVAPVRDMNSEIVGAVLVFRDISEKRKMEEELVRKQKLDSLGLLAGGIAHDFNNILAVIVTQVAVAKL